MARRATTPAERAERQERQRQLVEQSIEQLRSTDGWQRWLRARKAFRRYSIRNQILIALQAPEATAVAGFRKWLALGYCVRKGQTGIYIWAPMPPSRKRMAEWEVAGRPKDKKPRTTFGLTAVFDRAQVDELPPPARPLPLEPPIAPLLGDELAEHLPALLGLAEDYGYSAAIEAIDGPQDGYCSAQRQHIGIRDALSANAQATVAIHELAHMLVRVDRLDGDPEMDYATEEWVAETVAYMVADTLGLDITRQSAPYLASWSEGRSPEQRSATAGLIDRLARHIEDTVLVEPEADVAEKAPAAQAA